MLPGEDQLELAREGLAGPSVKLMRTVAQAIKEDLGAVKDVLDIFVRTGMQGIDKLGPQLEMLKKIGDTLGVLGLESARTQIQRETQELSGIVASNKPVDQALLEKIAATLLAVEDTLDRELVRSVSPSDGEAAPEEAGDDVQHKHVTHAVMSECIVNLAKVKEAVIQLVDQPGDVRVLEGAKPQLRGIVAGLLMLNKTKAVSVVERIGAVIGTRLAPGGPAFRPEYLERLADAIVSVEYYMETVSAGRNDPWYMLENAERCLDLLEKLPVVKVARERAAAPPAAPTPEPAPPKPAPKPAKRPSVMEVDEHRSDPELVELFIEEAKEEIASIQQHLPAWSENIQNSEALIALRRSFHTLKGSGRMVGAQLIGEFSWNIENLLNRLINQTLEITPPMVAFVGEAAKALPQLVEQLELGLPPKVDVHLLMKQAEAFAEGDPEAESLTGQSLRVQVLETPAEPAPAGMDPVLADIFVKEMRTHVEAIRKYLANAETRLEPHLVEEPLYRACHTLLGSGRMAGFEPAMALAGPMAEHLRRHFDAGTGLSSAGLAALRTAADEIETMAEAIVSRRDYSLNPALPALMAALGEGASTHAAPLIEHTVPEIIVPRTLAPEPGAGAPAAEAAATPQPVPAASFDPEIAAIFAEEAAELLDNAELALGTIRQTAEPAATVELQRLLHTLKGGARMAGVTPMGDLSHALETLLERIADGRLDATSESLDLVQRSLDQLQHMRDAIDSGRGVTPAPGLVAQLESVDGPQPTAAGAAVEPQSADVAPAPAAVEPPVAVEPPAAVEPPVDVEPAVEVEALVEVELSVEVEPPVEVELPPAAAEAEPAVPEELAASAAPPSAPLAVTPPTPPTVAAEPEDLMESTGVIELTAADIEELESIELKALPEFSEDAAPLTNEELEDPTSVDEALVVAEPTIVEDTGVIARLVLETVPPEQPAVEARPEAPAAQPAADLRSSERAETARVDAALLDALLNGAGEINIFQSRITQQMRSIEFHLGRARRHGLAAT